MPDRIPITVAERIGKEHGYDQVIINARRANADDTAVTLEWVTTWGKNKLHCDIAARIGNAIRDNVAPTIDRLNDALTRETARADAAEKEAKALREAALDLLKNDGGGMGDYNAGRALIARWVLAIRTGHRVIFSAPEAIRGEVATTLAQPADGGK